MPIKSPTLTRLRCSFRCLRPADQVNHCCQLSQHVTVLEPPGPLENKSWTPLQVELGLWRMQKNIAC